MLDRVASPLAALIEERRPGHNLEAAFYTSPEIFQADLEAIFYRHWIFVAVEPDIPEPGDAMVVEIGAYSIVIVRDDDMNVAAFHNVCRHRGARLVSEPKTTVGNLVCRYHAWTYDLSGRLIHAAHMGASFDPSCHGLRPVHVRSLEGLIFLCLSEDPPADFDDMAATMAPYLAPHRIPDTKVAFESELIEHGNWKLTMENNRECYHCAGNHPELGQSFYAVSFGYDPATASEEERDQACLYDAAIAACHAEWEREGLPSRLVEDLVDRPTGFRAERLPLVEAGESQTMDSRIASRRLLGHLSSKRLGGLHFWTQPNSWHHFMSDHAVAISALPLAPDRTLVRTKWLVHKDAVEGVDYDLANLTRVWTATNEQDGELVGLCQQGVESAAYAPGPYSPHTETLVDAFCRWYLGRLHAHVAV